MYIELLDIHAAKPVTLEGERTIGRAGGPADIVVPDERVSSMHARIYPDGGRWYLEDVGSSNGTFVKGNQVAGPVELSEGMSFALCEYTFQVLRIVNSAVGVESAMGMGDEGGATQVGGAAASMASGAHNTITDTERDVSRSSASIRMGVSQPQPGAGPGAPQPTGPTGPTPGTAGSNGNGRAGISQAAAGGVDAVGEGVADMEKQSFGDIISYQFTGVPKAFAYYLAAVPVMLFNPLGTIKKSVAEQKFPAFGTKEIIAYTIPPMALSVIVNQLGAIIVSIVNGVFGVGLLIAPIIGVVVAAVAAFITGFLMHPVLGWFVRFLGGQSDARSRTNYFITAQTVLPIIALATGITVLLSIIPVPFITVVTPLLQLVGSLILLTVAYFWFKYFQVAKWFPIVILVLMGLSALGGLFQVFGQVRYGIAQLRGGGAVVAGGGGAGGTTTTGTTNDPVELAKQSIAARRAAGQTVSAEEEKQILAAARQSRDAMANAGGGTGSSGGSEGGATTTTTGMTATTDPVEAAKRSIAAQRANGQTVTAQQEKQILEAARRARANMNGGTGTSGGGTSSGGTSTEGGGATTGSAGGTTTGSGGSTESGSTGSGGNGGSGAGNATAEATPKKKGGFFSFLGGGKEEATPTPAPTPLRVASGGAGPGRSSYQEYARRRKLVEEAIEQEPPLLKLKGVAPLYKEMIKRSIAVEQKYKKRARGNDPDALAQQEVNKKLVEADTYVATVEIVDKLYAKIFPQ